MSQVVWNQMSQRRCRLLCKSVTCALSCPGPRPRTKYGQQERECINSINTSTSPYVLICRILILIFRADHITAAATRCSASVGSRVTRRARRSGQQWTAAARQWVRRTQIHTDCYKCMRGLRGYDQCHNAAHVAESDSITLLLQGYVDYCTCKTSFISTFVSYI